MAWTFVTNNRVDSRTGRPIVRRWPKGVAFVGEGTPVAVLNCGCSDDLEGMLAPSLTDMIQNEKRSPLGPAQRKKQQELGRTAGDDRAGLGPHAGDPDDPETMIDDGYDEDAADFQNGNYGISLETGRGEPGHQYMVPDGGSWDGRGVSALNPVDLDYADAGYDARTERIDDDGDDDLRDAKSMIPPSPIEAAISDSRRAAKLRSIQRDRANQMRAGLRSY